MQRTCCEKGVNVMSSKVKKWGVVAGMALLAAAVLFAGGIIGGVVTGVIPVRAEEDNPWPWPGHFRGWGGPGDIVETVAEVLGLTPEDLSAELQGGKSVAEVAEAQGVDTQTIVDAVNAEIEQWVQEALDEGRLTQEQADKILESLGDADAERLLGLAMPFGPHMRGAFGRGWGGPWGGLDAAAEVLGMEPEDLMAELREGKTLTEIAEEKGVDPQAVQDAMLARMEEMVQQAEEDGTLTPECAECARQRFQDCEGNWLERPHGFFGKRHGGRGPFGGFWPGGPAPEEG
jgi:uncharacterized protein YidB (DUF937 family)